MDDVIVKVDKKVYLPLLFFLIFVSIFFLVFLILSIIHHLMGYYVYFMIYFPFVFVRLYLEIKWLSEIYVIFKEDKLILNIVVIKKAKGNRAESFYYFYRPFIRHAGGRKYVTSYATVEKIEINYSDILKYEIVKHNDLEITTDKKKYLIMTTFFYYQKLSGKWKSEYRQFSKKQIQYIYDELEKRIK